MSTTVMALCWPLQMPPTPKSVLMSLADNANDQGHCWPSLSTICMRTCFGRTAVIDAITWLEEHKAVKGDRSNGRHTSYIVTPDRFDPSASRTGTPAGPVRLADGTGSPPGRDPSASRTGPVRQADTNRKEPSGTVRSNRKVATSKSESSVQIPEWLPPDAWTNWVQHRKALKKPMTERAQELAIKELDKLREQGYDPRVCIDNAILKSWQGIYPPRDAAQQGASAPRQILSPSSRPL